MIKYIKLIRIFLLKRIFWRNYRIGKYFHVGRNVVLWGKKGIVIGDNCYIGRNSQIECTTIIKNNVIISNNVSMVGRYDHNFQQIGTPIRSSLQIRDRNYFWKGLEQKIVIEDDVWIGCGSIILSGVNIGFGSIVAAGSVVVKDIESFSIYAGNPAKKIGMRFINSEDQILHKKEYIIFCNKKRINYEFG